MPLLGSDGNGTPRRRTWTTEQLVTASVVSAMASYAATRFYKTRLRRIPTVSHLTPEWMRKKSLYGKVTRVGDGDNFHFYHTPGGRWAAWGVVRRVPGESRKLKEQTLHVRLAGIDAPECAHFGRPGQPHGPEAMAWLKARLLGRYVRVMPHARDQYARVVATVHRRTWFGLADEDVGLEMLRAGFATVYEAKFGCEFGGMEEKYREAERRARERNLGMWNEPGTIGKLLLGRRAVKDVETPRQYKTRVAEEGKKASDR